jgi:hypothetical protein
VAAEGRHLLTDDDLEGQALVECHRPGRDGGIDALVVGDGDDVEVAARGDVLEDGDHAGRAIGCHAVDVQVGATEAGSTHGAASRSGQIGKKTDHHCSGASAMTRS